MCYSIFHCVYIDRHEACSFNIIIGRLSIVVSTESSQPPIRGALITINLFFIGVGQTLEYVLYIFFNKVLTFQIVIYFNTKLQQFVKIFIPSLLEGMRFLVWYTLFARLSLTTKLSAFNKYIKIMNLVYSNFYVNLIITKVSKKLKYYRIKDSITKSFKKYKLKVMFCFYLI